MKKSKDLDSSQVVSNYQNCLSWLSEIQTWQDGVRFMETTLIKYSTNIEEENQIVELRDLHNELNGNFCGKLEWLKGKLEVYRTRLKLLHKETSVILPGNLNTQHKTFQIEVTLARDNYLELKRQFYRLLGPSLRKNNSRNKTNPAA